MNRQNFCLRFLPTFAYRLFFTYKLLFLLKKVVRHKISSLHYKIVSSPAAIFVVFVLFVINIYDLIRLKLIKGSYRMYLRESLYLLLKNLCTFKSI